MSRAKGRPSVWTVTLVLWVSLVCWRRLSAPARAEPVSTRSEAAKSTPATNSTANFHLSDYHNSVVTIADHVGNARGVLSSDTSVSWQLFSRKDPRILMIDHLISDLECKEFMALAEKRLQRSSTLSEGANSIRTSSGMFMSRPGENEIPVNRKLRLKLAEILGIPHENLEPTQVIRYHPGEHYLKHMDTFGEQRVNQPGVGGERIATVLVRLNAVPPGQGGETAFNDRQLKVSPPRGSAIVFFNVHPDGQLDPHSEHEAIPPAPGTTKWVLVIGTHLKPFTLRVGG